MPSSLLWSPVTFVDFCVRCWYVLLQITNTVHANTLLTFVHRYLYACMQIYCHAFSNRRRVLDWQLDLLQSYTQVQYNWVSPDSLSLITHNRKYHNTAVSVSTATAPLASVANTILVSAELQVPFLFVWSPTNQPNSLDTNSLQLLSRSRELRGIWPLDGL
jgi:hypothetical protein